MMKFSFPILIFFVLCSAAFGAELAVVVNKSNTLESIGSAQLRLMLMGELTRWPDGKAVTPVQTSLESPEGVLVLKVIYKMTPASLKRYYMQATFVGKDIAQPAGVTSANALKQLVARTPGAVGCILASEVDKSVTVLKVDGSAPGDAGYKLK
jgi:ABC-type phosphate transport system substrate-binding protein